MARKTTTPTVTPETNGTVPTTVPTLVPAAAAGKKTKCPVSREQFRTHAKAITVKVGDREFLALAKEFSTGSLGWNVNDKITLMVGDTPVTVQVGMNLTLVGSKELPM